MSFFLPPKDEPRDNAELLISTVEQEKRTTVLFQMQNGISQILLVLFVPSMSLGWKLEEPLTSRGVRLWDTLSKGIFWPQNFSLNRSQNDYLKRFILTWLPKFTSD